jgi:hypothetical protein
MAVWWTSAWFSSRARMRRAELDKARTPADFDAPSQPLEPSEGTTGVRDL